MTTVFMTNDFMTSLCTLYDKYFMKNVLMRNGFMINITEPFYGPKHFYKSIFYGDFFKN